MSIKQLINRNNSTVNENSSIFSIFLVWLFVCFSFNVVSTYTARIEEIYQMFRKDKHQRSKYWLCKFGSRLQVTILYHRKVLLSCFHTNFRFKRVLGFVKEEAWFSKLLLDAALTADRAVMWVKKMVYFGNVCYLNRSCIIALGKVLL